MCDQYFSTTALKAAGKEPHEVRARERRERAGGGEAKTSSEQRRRARVRPKTAGAATSLSRERKSVSDDLPDRQELEVRHLSNVFGKTMSRIGLL